MQLSLRVSRTAALLGEPMMPEKMSAPASICLFTADGVSSALYWSSSIATSMVTPGSRPFSLAYLM